MNATIRSVLVPRRVAGLALTLVALLLAMLPLFTAPASKSNSQLNLAQVSSVSASQHRRSKQSTVRANSPVTSGPGEERAAVMIPTYDDWASQLRDPVYWAAQKADKPAGRSESRSNRLDNGERDARSGLTIAHTGNGVLNLTQSLAKSNKHALSKKFSDDENNNENSETNENTYRTMCVRLCDGYYWPISFATTEDNFERDQKACARSCEGPVKLYTYKNPGGDLGDMEDLKGQPYKRLTTAFSFRTSFEPSCKCKPHPWEQEALDRHRVLAMEAKKNKLGQQAQVELKELKSKVANASSTARDTAKIALSAIETEAAARGRGTRKAASRNSVDRSGIGIASLDASTKPSIPASNGVIVMRLGAKPPMTLKPDERLEKRAGKQTLANAPRISTAHD
jgi:Protein of unknown function (DUF2865)